MLCQPQVGAREPRVATARSCAKATPIGTSRPATERTGPSSPRSGAPPPGRSRDRRGPRRPARCGRVPAPRRPWSRRGSRHAATRSAASQAIASIRSPSDVGKAIATTRALINSRSRSTTSCRRRGSSSSPHERRADLLQRLELPRPGGGRLVQTRVLDRDGRLRRKESHELLVLLVEVRSALLLGQVEVPVGDARAARSGCRGRSPSADGPAESRRSAGSSARSWRRSVRASVINAPRMPRPRGRSPITAARLVVDAVRDEPLEARPGRIDDAERGVSRTGDECRRLDYALENPVERKLRADCEPGLQQGAQPV